MLGFERVMRVAFVDASLRVFSMDTGLAGFEECHSPLDYTSRWMLEVFCLPLLMLLGGWLYHVLNSMYRSKVRPTSPLRLNKTCTGRLPSNAHAHAHAHAHNIRTGGDGAAGEMGEGREGGVPLHSKISIQTLLFTNGSFRFETAGPPCEKERSELDQALSPRPVSVQ